MATSLPSLTLPSFTISTTSSGASPATYAVLPLSFTTSVGVSPAIYAVPPPSSTYLAGINELPAGNYPVLVPVSTTLYNSAGISTAVSPLIYLLPGGSLTTPAIAASGGSANSPISASSSAFSSVNSGPTSPPASTSPSPSVNGPSITASDTSTPIAHIPSSTSPSTFTSSKSTKQTNTVTPTPSPRNRLANGTVAGIVVGVALGLALLTFLATFLAIRRRGGSRDKRNRQISDGDGGPSGSARHQTRSSEPKQPLVTQMSSGSNSFDDFLPQSADDKTVQNEVKTVLDQIELHVENFYQNTQASGSRLADAELAMFHSPYLPSTLTSLLQQTNNSVLLIKHALAHFITACITTPSDKDYADWSLLPKDFVLLPNAVRARGSSKSTKQGFTQSMSRWRALTAYLRPNALEDKDYITERDRQINIIVQKFSIAFAPWQNPRYKDEDRVHSLVAILKDAAAKGIWLFSQPSEFQFQWRKLSPSRIAVAPALVKVTDERGQILGEPQVMIDLTAKKV